MTRFSTFVLLLLVAGSSESCTSTAEQQQGEQCSVHTLPDGGLPSPDDRCIHTGPGSNACCALAASKYDVQRGCKEPAQVLHCAIGGPVGYGTSCAFGTAEACYVKTLSDGGLEYWTTTEVYEGYSDIVGTPCDNATYQQLVGSPECPTAR